MHFTHSLDEMDFTKIHGWLTASYWSPGISRERVERGFRGATVVVGCFDGARQVGVARCTSDTTRFAYVADVFVDEGYRGQGIARTLVGRLLAHPDVADVDTVYLQTQDAHGVYRALGFELHSHPERVMVRRRPHPAQRS